MRAGRKTRECPRSPRFASGQQKAALQGHGAERLPGARAERVVAVVVDRRVAHVLARLPVVDLGRVAPQDDRLGRGEDVPRERQRRGALLEIRRDRPALVADVGRDDDLDLVGGEGDLLPDLCRRFAPGFSLPREANGQRYTFRRPAEISAYSSGSSGT